MKWLVRSWIWVTCALAASACTPIPSHPLDIATTTSVQNSGLLDVLLPAYLEQTGTAVRVHAAGSGRALQMLEDGLASLVISHAPQTEARMLARHPRWVRRELAYNWFVIVGPSSDPAGIRTAGDAAEAFRRVARSTAGFVSRGDFSGTHERENTLWLAAGTRPTPDRLLVSGRGMAQALRHADEIQGYTLTDEATFRQLEDRLDLVVLYEGDERLRNVYTVIHPGDDPQARAFANWLTEGGGRTLIQNYTIQGRPAFHLSSVD